jgi:hypothetical protein
MELLKRLYTYGRKHHPIVSSVVLVIALNSGITVPAYLAAPENNIDSLEYMQLQRQNHDLQEELDDLNKEKELLAVKLAAKDEMLKWVKDTCSSKNNDWPLGD